MTTTKKHLRHKRSATSIRCQRVVSVTVPQEGKTVTVVSKWHLLAGDDHYTTRTYYAHTQAHAKRISNAVLATLGKGNTISATLALALARLPRTERTTSTY